jgi:hypothetical protein
MADRFPLIVNSISRKIEELISGDNLDLTGNGISINGNLGSSGMFLSTNGTTLQWEYPKDTITKIKGGYDGTYITGNISFDEGDSGNITIVQAGGSIKIDSKDTVTRVRGTDTGVYVGGDITIAAAGNTEITQSGATIIIDSNFTQVKSDWNAVNSIAEILNKPFVPKNPSVEISTTPFGSGNLEYNQSTGVFTYTPPNLSGLAIGGNEENWDTAYSWGDHALVGYLVATEDDKNNWNTAYSWGNHAVEGYLVATEDDKNNWNDAFSWGDHALEGYLKVESDPVFTASVSYTIAQFDINNWNDAYSWGDHAAVGYLTSYTESDPVFSASVAFNIELTDVTNWNTAFSWGDHALVGYISEESDPVFSASPAFGISTTDINQWGTAYSWGDHAEVGYLTSLIFPERQTVSFDTTVIAIGGVVNVEIPVAKSYLLQKVETSAAAWITLYTDNDSRIADATRNETTDPQAGSGVIAEIITTGPFIQKITPGTIGWNDDLTPSNNVYLKVVNKSAAAQAITITLTYVQMEG